MKARGSNVDACIKMQQWMKRCPYIENVGYKEISVPLGPWMQRE